jgi:hypothetical protein
MYKIEKEGKSRLFLPTEKITIWYDDEREKGD